MWVWDWQQLVLDQFEISLFFKSIIYYVIISLTKLSVFIKYKHINDINETSIEFLMIFAEEWSLTFNLMMVVSGRLSKIEEEKVNSEEFFLSPVVLVGLGLGAIMAWIHFLLSSRSTLVQRASPLLHGLSIRTSQSKVVTALAI